jgi:hypothetical protein
MGMKRAATLLSIAAAVTTADAQLIEPVRKSSASGLMVSVSGQVAHNRFENERDGQSGEGVTAMIGYGFTPTYALVLTASSAVFHYDGGSYVAEQIALGARIHMANAQWRWVPYIELAIGPVRSVDEGFTVCSFVTCTRGELRRSGAVYAQAVGVSFYPVRKLALSIAGHVNVGQMSRATFQGQEMFSGEGTAQDLRLSLGGTWIIGGPTR